MSIKHLFFHENTLGKKDSKESKFLIFFLKKRGVVDLARLLNHTFSFFEIPFQVNQLLLIS
jgi:hypothetical protein